MPDTIPVDTKELDPKAVADPAVDAKAAADKVTAKPVDPRSAPAPVATAPADTVAKTDDSPATKKSGAYTVAPGRHVITDDGAFEEGTKVKLNPKDAKRFLELGFIRDADGAIIIHGEGPAVNVEDGMQVRT